MNELVFIQYVFYLLGIFAIIKIFIIELEDVIMRSKKLVGKIRKNPRKE
jgi:hypothetical protein